MTRIVTDLTVSLSLHFRHRWLGMAFIRLTAVPVYFGWAPSDRAVKVISAIAYRLMGPTIGAS